MRLMRSLQGVVLVREIIAGAEPEKLAALAWNIKGPLESGGFADNRSRLG